MLLFVPAALAVPLLGDPDRLARGEVFVAPGAELFPVNGYGGSVTPELYAGAGFGQGWDLTAGAGVDVPVYYRDDGALHWGYAPPSLGFVDVAVRWFSGREAPGPGLPGWDPAGRFSVALRVSTGTATPSGTLAAGPELGWTWTNGRATWNLRASFLTHPEGLPYDFGVLTPTSALTYALGGSALFVELEPWFWMGLGSRGNSDLLFMVQPGLAARAGVWLNPGGRHAVAIAAVYRFDHGFEAEDLSLLVKWRIGVRPGAPRPDQAAGDRAAVRRLAPKLTRRRS